MKLQFENRYNVIGVTDHHVRYAPRSSAFYVNCWLDEDAAAVLHPIGLEVVDQTMVQTCLKSPLSIDHAGGVIVLDALGPCIDQLVLEKSSFFHFRSLPWSI
ncbi:hypothetical protein [Burkholderia pseudomallei]|uniref:hypothetical protein n=1 Tax=Burkholderia pseudomallei TaxID=28450 RepID=UPI0018A24824|nr:hypothetical protein [Burkholderia pseudomallei]